jgi:hypothetical protein
MESIPVIPALRINSPGGGLKGECEIGAFELFEQGRRRLPEGRRYFAQTGCRRTGANGPACGGALC